MESRIQQFKQLVFTTFHDGIARSLNNTVQVSKAYDPAKVDNIPEKKEYEAIWDTGATHTVISKRVVDELNLKLHTKRKTFIADGSLEKCDVFLINLVLPNHVEIIGVAATHLNIGASCDVLIGMDVIRYGDFAISNYNNKTIHTFRIPSLEPIDFITVPKSPIKVPKIGRNDPCPCGSGLKYKKCHGR